MKRRSLLVASAALAAAPLGLSRTVHAQATNGRAKIVLWHAMTGPLAESVNLLVNGFNEAMEGWGREDNEIAARLMSAGIRRRNLKFAAVA